MTTQFDLLHRETVSALSKDSLVYYADAYTLESKRIHLLQLTQVIRVAGDSVFLDNGKKFSIADNTEVCKGNSGAIYIYSKYHQALIANAQTKLSLLAKVDSINLAELSLQQLSMILDVSRGAFTQVTAPTPCGGGCGDTVNVAGIDIEIEHELASQDLLAKHPSPDVLAPIAFNDATYELSDSELDAIEDADEDDEYDAKEALNQD